MEISTAVLENGKENGETRKQCEGKMVLKMSPNKNIERWSRTRFWKIKDWSKHTRRKRLSLIHI